ncbi:ABC transporter permease [Limimaricola cinnabarinus]|jgi:ABC-type polysaccharide/polyol phosphate export permease|uniref:ABC transporter permease n=1 Tax=Limimaricola cinnabarinus TaxID=1125964 RepID=A0A2G1MDS0_9RHOB|nr:ABC transporter permease [Limimaricola cinnabarinus]PHP26885.1 ABC transporter permease [Limimaricola cinnabarinus]
MFQGERPRGTGRRAAGMAELIYHSTVREIRKSHRNALAGLAMNIAQTVIFVLAFYMMFALIGARGAGLRGDFLLYLMSGIFLFLTHTKAVAAVVKADGPASSMMKHAPLNTAVTISAAALGSLYIQVLSLLVVLFFYHVLVTPVVIEDPVGAMAMLLVSWFSGVGVGMIFMAIKPWLPEFTQIGVSVYSRTNMIASGKMFVANTLPGYMLAVFDWNPLFHAIDQARGYIFLNYTPHFTSALYPLWVGLALVAIGMMAEFFTRRRASVSWGAGR